MDQGVASFRPFGLPALRGYPHQGPAQVWYRGRIAGLVDAHILLHNEGDGGIIYAWKLRKSCGHTASTGGATEDCAPDNRPLSDLGLGRCFAGLSIVPIMGRCLGMLVEPHLSHIRLGRSPRLAGKPNSTTSDVGNVSCSGCERTPAHCVHNKFGCDSREHGLAQNLA